MKAMPVVLVLFAGAAPALEPVQMSKSVYFIRGETGLPSIANRGFTSNAGFVVTAEGVVVFDALGTPALGQELVDAIRRITAAPIRRVFLVGPAHIPEDLAILVAEEGVLFVGDLMFAGRVPFVGEADTRAWIEAIDRIVSFSPRVMIGGHGDASRDVSADLRLTRDYLAFLRETMGAAARELVDFEEAYASTDWSRFAHLPAFEAANRRNAFNTYIRMQGGDR